MLLSTARCGATGDTFFGGVKIALPMKLGNAVDQVTNTQICSHNLIYWDLVVTCLVWSNHEEKYLRNRWIHTLLDVIETNMTTNDPGKMGQRRTSFRNQILGKEEFVLVVLWKVYITGTQQRFCFNRRLDVDWDDVQRFQGWRTWERWVFLLQDLGNRWFKPAVWSGQNSFFFPSGWVKEQTKMNGRIVTVTLGAPFGQVSLESSVQSGDKTVVVDDDDDDDFLGWYIFPSPPKRRKTSTIVPLCVCGCVKCLMTSLIGLLFLAQSLSSGF